jgi:hypothetical protein
MEDSIAIAPPNAANSSPLLGSPPARRMSCKCSPRPRENLRAARQFSKGVEQRPDPKGVLEEFRPKFRSASDFGRAISYALDLWPQDRRSRWSAVILFRLLDPPPRFLLPASKAFEDLDQPAGHGLNLPP